MVNTGLQFSATPVGIRQLAPEFGQHTEEVLLDAGYSWEEIESLRTEGVIGVATPQTQSAE
jgi:crotonobetainyl-CoA:carnitine CoA-transferase CaiB-like acyl-CoA transferase